LPTSSGNGEYIRFKSSKVELPFPINMTNPDTVLVSLRSIYYPNGATGNSDIEKLELLLLVGLSKSVDLSCANNSEIRLKALANAIFGKCKFLFVFFF
jgi:hypothetical protein